MPPFFYHHTSHPSSRPPPAPPFSTTTHQQRALNYKQVHLTYWTSTSVLVSFASCAAMLNTTRARSTAGVLSAVFWGASPDTLDRRAEGVATAYAIDYSSRGGVSYSSPLLHHVLLRNLTPGSTIFYAPATNAGDSKADLSQAPRGARVYKFTVSWCAAC